MNTKLKAVLLKAGIYGIILFFISCATETEQQEIDAVKDIYGGAVSFSKSVTNEGGTAKTYFKVKISESEMIDSLSPNMTSANIAKIIYEGMTQQEKDNYTRIDVEMLNLKKDTSSFNYPIPTVEVLSAKSKNFTNFSNHILNREWSKLDEIKNPEDIKSNLALGLEAKIKEMELSYGSLKSFLPIGIAQSKMRVGSVYHYQGFLQFANGKNNPYVVVIDVAEGKDKVVGFRIF